MDGTQRLEPRIVGRERELAAVVGFGAGDARHPSMLIVGGPGVGKTTLWDAGLQVVREHGVRTLVARPSDTEARLDFAGLTDLLQDVPLDTLEALPAPQRNALDAALLRSETTGAVPERATAYAVLNVLRALAARETVLVAVDDVQWLDRPTSDALVFAARRLEAEDVRFLLTRRPGEATPLERTCKRRGLEGLDVGPLSLGAVRRLLVERLELSVTRHVLRRVYDVTLGNPLFALELGRTLVDRDPLGAGEEIPVPADVDSLLGLRVSSLTEPQQTVLLATALCGGLGRDALAELVDTATVDEALDTGLLSEDEGVVRPFHPLLGAAAVRQAGASERRRLHLALSDLVAEAPLRARHRALATDRPDPALAESLAASAADASARGATQDAIELAQHALRLTEDGSPERQDRVLALARYLVVAGEGARASELLAPEVDSLPPGAPRVRAYLLLWHGSDVRSNADIQRYLRRALDETRGDPTLRASVLGDLANTTACIGVERIPEAEQWALEAVATSAGADADVRGRAVLGLAWARALRGRAVDDLLASESRSSRSSAARVAGQRLVWRGELEEARRLLTRLAAMADERGESSYVLLRLHLCELDLRAGAWASAENLLEAWAESSDRTLWPMYERSRALLAAGRGLPGEAERWATETIEIADATGVRWDLLEARRAIGTTALLSGDPARAADELGTVWEHCRREGVDEPGVFPVAPDLVEALLELGEHEEARSVTGRLADLAERQEHPWGRASAMRSEALVRLAAGAYDEHSATALRAAVESYAACGLRFDRARTLLALGRAQRRHRKWGAARAALEEATSAFEELASPGWADAARSELSRVGARRPRSTGELTAAERRTAELAAQGLQNKEIARMLFVSTHTVEAHLSKAYAKLGIRSRAQLAGALRDTKQ